MGVGANEHGDVGGDLVVARAGGVQATADGPDDLGQPPLDRHVDVLVGGIERKRAVGELGANLIESPAQLLAVRDGDDPLRGEHRRVGDRLIDVVGAQPPVEADRVVEPPEGVGTGLVEAVGAAGGAHRRSSERTPSSSTATRSIWPSVIAGKNGSAIERAETSSQTGNSPSRWPKRSR